MNRDDAIREIEAYQPLIRKVCGMYAQDNAEADDMFQEICIQAWRASEQFKGDAKFSTWLYRIAINTAISWIRKEKKHKLNNAGEDKFYGVQDESPFYEKEDQREQIAQMHRAINQLNDLDRSLILLYLEDVSYAEISEILGLSIANIKVKMNRLKKRLKKMMENDR